MCPLKRQHVLDETIDDTEDAAPEIESGTLEDIAEAAPEIALDVLLNDCVISSSGICAELYATVSFCDENLPAAASIASVPDSPPVTSNFLTKSAA